MDRELSDLNDVNRRPSGHQQYTLHILASDSLHTVETQVVVKIKRADKTMPSFTNNSNYFVEIDPKEKGCVLNSINCEILQVKAMLPNPSVEDENDYQQSYKVTYSLQFVGSESNFYVDHFTGVIYNNRTLRYPKDKLYQLTVFAGYSNKKGIRNQASVMIKVLGSIPIEFGNEFNKDKPIAVEADLSKLGETILKLPDSLQSYRIVGENASDAFAIMFSNELAMVKLPDKSEYYLKITATGVEGDDALTVHVKIKRGNEENYHSAFKSMVFNVDLNEAEVIGSEVISVKPTASAEHFKYAIFSGNDLKHFRIDETSGTLFINADLDFESRQEYELGITAQQTITNRIQEPMIAIVKIRLLNANDNVPKFPISHYKAFVDENSPIGSKIIKISAIDNDNSLLNYSIVRVTDRILPFALDPSSGYLVTTDLIDFESIELKPPTYKFIIKTVDSSGTIMSPSATQVLVDVCIGSVDEYTPRFTSESYEFTVTYYPGMTNIRVGQVLASDADLGVDGRVTYSLRSTSPSHTIDYFKLNATTGVITLNTNDIDANQRHSSLIISASSGRPNSLSALTVVEVTMIFIGDSVDSNGIVNDENAVALGATSAALPGWVLFLIVLLMLITVVLLVSIVVIRLHQQQHLMSGHGEHVNGSHGHLGSLLRKIGSGNSNAVAYGHHHPHGAHHPGYVLSGTAPALPPRYNDVTLASPSGVVGEGHSASSGRGSAEDDDDDVEGDHDVDEEIRMINEGGDYYTSSMHDDGGEDVTTTAEYLARLGVVNHQESELGEDMKIGVNGSSQYNNNAMQLDEADITLDELGNICAPRPSVIFSSVRSHLGSGQRAAAQGQTEEWPSMCGSLSSIVHSEEELSGSYNWAYLKNWGPTVEPISSVFAEIVRMKETQNDNSPDAIAAAIQAAESGSTISSSTASSHRYQSSNGGRHHRHHVTSSPSIPTPISPSFQPSLSPLAAPSSSTISIATAPMIVTSSSAIGVDDEMSI